MTAAPKTMAVTGTVTAGDKGAAVAAPEVKTIPGTGGGVLINGDLQPSDNPHSWLPLIGAPPGTPGLRILYGVLRPTYRDRTNTAVAFGRAKLQPVPSPGGDAWAVTAHRVHVLLPGGTEDRLGTPRKMLEELDAERPADCHVLLTYVTITGLPGRLHEQFELVRAWAMVVVADLSVPVILVQHAPRLNAGTAPDHVHLLFSPRRTAEHGADGPLGLGSLASVLTGDRGRGYVIDSFTAFITGRVTR